MNIAALIASAIVVVVIFAAAPTFLHNRLVYGTFATAGAPPRVDFCGRRYHPGLHAVTAPPAGLSQVDTAPSGMPVLADVMSPAEQSRYHTDVCTMELWIQTGRNSYLPYVLSGGP